MKQFATHVFDVDGTLLDTARAKSEAFYEAARDYGLDAAEWLRDYHRAAGSMSREDQVRALFTEYLGLPDVADAEVERVMGRIAEILAAVYERAQKVPGATAYLKSVERRVCVSGIARDELGAILDLHGLTFDAVDSGSKTEVFARLIADGVITLPAVYFGDTEDDYLAATGAGLDFVLVEYGSEWTAPEHVTRVPDFRTLLQGERVRVGRDGYATVHGERRYFGRMLAGALVTVKGVS